MVMRVDKAGIQGLMDGVGIGSTGTGVPIVDDGTRNAPWEDKPWQSKGESIINEQIRLMQIPADEIRKTRPPVPQYLFPPDQGYDTTPLTIGEVLDTDRWSPNIRSWVSPDVRPVRRSATPDSGDGSDRNVGMSSSAFG